MYNIIKASETNDIEEFMSLAFPPTWGGIRARIIESGAQFADGMCPWAPRWSKIPLTLRKGKTSEETAFKSVIFRVHDCLHQLWGLPHPGSKFSEEDFYYYKRTQMCGEVAVLTLAEFVYAEYLYDTYPTARPWLWNRNALPLLKGPLFQKNNFQIAMRLDNLLHNKMMPVWVRNNEHARKFVEDYVPMLEKDRQQIDVNWALMKKTGWLPDNAPNVRFSRGLDGLELTLWMIEDFEHLLFTDSEVDRALTEFNRSRRELIILPEGWDS